MPIQLTCAVCAKAFTRRPSGVQAIRICCSRACVNKQRGLTNPEDIVWEGDEAKIPLRARDGSVRAYTVVDAADAEWVNQWRWTISPDGYVRRDERAGGRRQTIRLHRSLLGLTPEDKQEPDHINRNPLDNRRSNLRPIPHAANMQNQSSHGGASVHRGVSWDSANQKWTVQVIVGGKRHYFGRFSDELEAAEVARAARTRLMPYTRD